MPYSKFEVDAKFQEMKEYRAELNQLQTELNKKIAELPQGENYKEVKSAYEQSKQILDQKIKDFDTMYNLLTGRRRSVEANTATIDRITAKNVVKQMFLKPLRTTANLKEILQEKSKLSTEFQTVYEQCNKFKSSFDTTVKLIRELPGMEKQSIDLQTAVTPRKIS